ncbi:hypothetical protein WYO_0846 [Methylobacterium sp. GXF4]|jgi:hypothetical protein|uniref:Uncharacterized protein n=1 Tax=Methylobacterium brachiatum TaxID=269660 RepID=A0AAJ1WXC3_9HYPH|nr:MULTISPECIES: hypothetical protein [Methylobacterium]EIZ86475.1 hypothetical protein WYO_0846 [Methylobacterium sp. GXF4]MCB4804251.1 hypothetical protein [Methylobacterium brachiatum]MDQ0545262.1 hypothetical protein [Methylobacterium brachiatum]
MTTKPYTVEDYAFAQAEFYTYRRTLADYAALLSEAGALLRERTDRVTVTGIASQPPNGSATIDGRALPGAADIQRTLVRYRGAYERLRATWDGLPHAERAGQRPPPSELPTLRPAHP